MVGRFGSYILEVWQCRELILVLAKRDLQVQYAQTMLGVLWSLLQPLAAMLIYTLFFSQLVVLPGVDAPYALFVFTGILIWSNFSTILTQAGTSLMQNQQIIKKIYFPRLVLLLAKVAVSWVEFSISFCLLLVIAFWVGHPLPWTLVFVPLVVVVNATVALSLAVWLSVLTIRFRDFYHLVPLVISFGIWFTPVFYPGTILPERWMFLLHFNPVAGVIHLMRWAVLGDGLDPSYLAVLAGHGVLLLVGLVYFSRVEKKMVDYI